MLNTCTVVTVPNNLHNTQPKNSGALPLHWCHNERDGVWNHRRPDWLLSRLFRCRSKKISQLCVTGRRERNPPVTGGVQRTRNAENISIWWRLLTAAEEHYVLTPKWDVFYCKLICGSVSPLCTEWRHSNGLRDLAICLGAVKQRITMMTSSIGNICRVTGHLCGEFTGLRWIPRIKAVTQSFDIFFDLRLNKRLSKQWWCWWFETVSCLLWRQCNGVVGVGTTLLAISNKAPLFSGSLCGSDFDNLCYLKCQEFKEYANILFVS